MYSHAMAAAYASANNMMRSSQTVDTTSRSNLEALNQKVDRQNLIIQTLLMILVEKKVIHEDEFKEWMDYVDEMDGVRDGKLREDKSPTQCAQCGRKSPAGATKCIYCGADFEQNFLFRKDSGQ